MRRALSDDDGGAEADGNRITAKPGLGDDDERNSEHSDDSDDIVGETFVDFSRGRNQVESFFNPLWDKSELGFFFGFFGDYLCSAHEHHCSDESFFCVRWPCVSVCARPLEGVVPKDCQCELRVCESVKVWCSENRAL